MIKLDDILARELQDELDKEFDATRTRRRVTSHVRDNSLNNIRIGGVLRNNRQPSSSRNSVEFIDRLNNLRHNENAATNQAPATPSQAHSDSLKNAFSMLVNNNNNNNSTENTQRVPNILHPSIENDMLTMLARNISSNELNQTDNAISSNQRFTRQISHPATNRNQVSNSTFMNAFASSNPQSSFYPSHENGSHRHAFATHSHHQRSLAQDLVSRFQFGKSRFQFGEKKYFFRIFYEILTKKAGAEVTGTYSTTILIMTQMIMKYDLTQFNCE